MLLVVFEVAGVVDNAVLRRARVRKAAETAARPARCPITVEATPSDGRRIGSIVWKMELSQIVCMCFFSKTRILGTARKPTKPSKKRESTHGRKQV